MTINCKGRLVDLSSPKVMGILNTTPDSFFDGGSYLSTDSVLKRAEAILSEGADFIDLGGYSSRPGADFVSEEEETRRVVPAIEAILSKFPDALISVDTFRAGVARASVAAGAAIINDISAGHLDENMITTVADLKVPYILMHMKGTPETMQQFTEYDDLFRDIFLYFSERIGKCRELGTSDLIIDPGFGFSKTINQNYQLLHNLDKFEIFQLPVLAGISRKSMIYKFLGNKAEEALNGTSVLNTIALSRGANILRVHDVKEAVECVRLYNQVIGK